MDEPTKGAGFALPPPTAAVPRGKKILLGIGINAYRSSGWPKLNNAVHDVEEVEKLLRNDYDFDETVLLRDDEATAANIEEALYRYTDERVLGANDSLLIYYSGHGHLDRNERGYWVPVDAQQDRIASYIPNSRIRELIADMKCRHVLLVSDACFSGALFVKGMRSSASEMVAEEYEKRPSRWAFCSGRHDEQVSDGKPGGHSPFATAILQELALNTTRKLNIARLADKVIEITRANYHQMPEANPIQDAGHKGGQFVFTPKAHVPTKVAERNTGDWSYSPQFDDVKPIVFWKQPTVWLITGIILTALLLVALLCPGEQEPTTTTLVLSKNTFVLDTMELGTPATIRFEVKNTGQIEARLLGASYSVDEMRQLEGGGDQPIPPGDSRVFVFEWKPKMAGMRTFTIGINGLNSLQKHLTVIGRAYVREKPLVAVQEETIDKPTSTKTNTKPGRKEPGGSIITKPPPPDDPVDDPPPAPRFDTVYTDIPLDVKMWLVADDGKIYPTETIDGKQVFRLPKSKGLAGKSLKVFFKRTGKSATWDRQTISESGIQLPSGY